MNPFNVKTRQDPPPKKTPQEQNSSGVFALSLFLYMLLKSKKGEGWNPFGRGKEKTTSKTGDYIGALKENKQKQEQAKQDQENPQDRQSVQQDIKAILSQMGRPDKNGFYLLQIWKNPEKTGDDIYIRVGDLDFGPFPAKLASKEKSPIVYDSQRKLIARLSNSLDQFFQNFKILDNQRRKQGKVLGFWLLVKPDNQAGLLSEIRQLLDKNKIPYSNFYLEKNQAQELVLNHSQVKEQLGGD